MSRDDHANGLSVETRLDVLDLYARQSHAIDGGDAPGWAATFTPEGSFESPTFKLKAVGPAELTTFAADSNGAALARGDQLRHWLSSIVITPAGPDRLNVKAYMMILATSTAGSRVDRSLTFADELENHEGRWLVASRKVFRDA